MYARKAKVAVIFILFALGLLIWLLPIPGGSLLTVLATILLLKHSRWARVRYVRLKRRVEPENPLYKWLQRFDRLLKRRS